MEFRGLRSETKNTWIVVWGLIVAFAVLVTSPPSKAATVLSFNETRNVLGGCLNLCAEDFWCDDAWGSELCVTVVDEQGNISCPGTGDRCINGDLTNFTKCKSKDALPTDNCTDTFLPYACGTLMVGGTCELVEDEFGGHCEPSGGNPSGYKDAWEATGDPCIHN